MTHWPIVRDATLTLLRAFSGGTVYTATNSARNDWRVRDMADDSAVIQMWRASQFGNSLLGRAQMGMRQELHYPRVALLYRIGVGEGSYDAAISTVEDRAVAVITHFNQYLGLNAAEGVIRAEVTGMGIPDLIGSRSSSATTHARCEIDLTVACQIAMNPIEAGH